MWTQALVGITLLLFKAAVVYIRWSALGIFGDKQANYSCNPFVSAAVEEFIS